MFAQVWFVSRETRTAAAETERVSAMDGGKGKEGEREGLLETERRERHENSQWLLQAYEGWVLLSNQCPK